jgi:GTPase SAR1 family protein
MKSNSYEEVVKYILVGDSNVGKTSIIRSFCDKKFNEREKNTVGLDYG